MLLARSPALLSLVSQSNLQAVVSGVFQHDGDMLLDTRQLNTSQFVGPLYWKLPLQFEGNQVGQPAALSPDSDLLLLCLLVFFVSVVV